MSRYINRKVAVNTSQGYQESDIFDNRGVKKVTQYTTGKLGSFTKEEYDEIKYVSHIWTNGDRFWKLSNTFYGDPTLWWIIARWNFAPTESHVKEGDEIRIPINIARTLELIRG